MVSKLAPIIFLLYSSKYGYILKGEEKLDLKLCKLGNCIKFTYKLDFFGNQDCDRTKKVVEKSTFVTYANSHY